jgi:hypothetical protein
MPLTFRLHWLLSSVPCSLPVAFRLHWLLSSVPCSLPVAFRLHWLLSSVPCSLPVAFRLHWLLSSVPCSLPVAFRLHWLSSSVPCSLPVAFRLHWLLNSVPCSLPLIPQQYSSIFLIVRIASCFSKLLHLLIISFELIPFLLSSCYILFPITVILIHNSLFLLSFLYPYVVPPPLLISILFI